MKCEQEIQSIKAALRRLGGSNTDGDPNLLEVVLLKVKLTSLSLSSMRCLSSILSNFCIFLTLRWRPGGRPSGVGEACSGPAVVVAR